MIPELDLEVWGRPTVDHCREFRPLLGVPPRGPQRWRVVMAHGHFERPNAAEPRSSPIFPEDIAAAGLRLRRTGPLGRLRRRVTGWRPGIVLGGAPLHPPGSSAVPRRARHAAASGWRHGHTARLAACWATRRRWLGSRRRCLRRVADPRSWLPPTQRGRARYGLAAQTRGCSGQRRQPHLLVWYSI